MGKNQLNGILALMRPAHYIKNLFVILPLFFSGRISDLQLFENSLLAFVSFCLIASSVYIFNDIFDIDEDRIHPQNKKRPIASGTVSVRLAYLLDVSFSLAGLLIAWQVNIKLFYVVIGYKFLNIVYTLIIKKIAIMDVMVLSLGFVIRLFAGAVTTGVHLTEWIIIMTYLLSLLIVLGKRRNDVIIFEQQDIVLRKVVNGYNSLFLNQVMVLLSSVIIVAYIMYTVSPEIHSRLGTEYLFVTVFWVVAGVLRYLQLLFVFKANDNPVRLFLKDNPLKLIMLAWFLNFFYFLYLH